AEKAMGGASFAASDKLMVDQTPTGHFGFRVSPHTAVTGSVNASIDSSDLVTGSLLESSGIATYGTSVNVLQKGHRVSFGAAHTDYAGVTSTTHRFGIELPNGLMLGYTKNREQGSALGMRGSGAFDIVGAKSDFVTVGWTGDVAGFNLTGEALAGRTNVETRNSLIEFTSPVLSSGFRFKAEREAFGGMALLGLTSPLKVERANLRYTAPGAYDLATRSVVNQTSYIDLAPTAREFNLEMGWAKTLGQGRLSLNGA